MWRRTVYASALAAASIGIYHSTSYKNDDIHAFFSSFGAASRPPVLNSPNVLDSSKPKRLFDVDNLPVVDNQQIVKATAPNVPPATNRKSPAIVVVEISSEIATIKISPDKTYEAWTFDGTVPGPIIRARVGDILEVRHVNKDVNGMAHNIDFHSVIGPGGGAPALFAEAEETKVGRFLLKHPGLFFYHCAAAPVPAHIANGMYGLILVEPEEGLAPVDQEFYVMQSEYYAEASTGSSKNLEFDYAAGLNETPSHVVFNGRTNALVDAPLMLPQGQRARLYFGNAGPNLVSSFHIIGAIFDKVYREGDLVSPPARHIQTTLVPAGGAAAVEFDGEVPGSYTLVDHSIFRLDKGAVGFVKVRGQVQRQDIYDTRELPQNCPNCKLHQ